MDPCLFELANIITDVAYIPLPSLLLLIKLLQHVQNCVSPNPKSNYYFLFFLSFSFFALYTVQWMRMYIFMHPFFLHVFGPLMNV